jgi:hypothetical protein
MGNKHSNHSEHGLTLKLNALIDSGLDRQLDRRLTGGRALVTNDPPA